MTMIEGRRARDGDVQDAVRAIEAATLRGRTRDPWTALHVVRDIAITVAMTLLSIVLTLVLVFGWRLGSALQDIGHNPSPAPTAPFDPGVPTEDGD